LIIMAGPGRSSWSLRQSLNWRTLPVSVLAKRKPLLLFRLVGLFLLRLAERNLLGLLFQEPPRRTREEQGASQGCAVGRAEPSRTRRRQEVEASKRIATGIAALADSANQNRLAFGET
jgi:hypothetical protein